MIDGDEDKFIMPTFRAICFAIIFFFLFYTLSLILFIGIFPVISDFINNFIKDINGYQICLISIFASIITVLYYIIKDIRKFVNR